MLGNTIHVPCQPCRHGHGAPSRGLRGRPADRWPVARATPTLHVCPQNQGVGLDFVRKPEYGRLRWPAYPAGTNNDRLISMRDGGIVALPQLTDEQRAAALEKAAAARRARAELKDRLKRGGTNLTQVLKDAESDEVLGKMKVSALLEALPKVGKVKAQEIMTELEIAPTRRLRGLGDRQRKALLEKFGSA
ncbi:integration host factor MihF [Mycobacterium tuberculosis XTB13-197]|uniref:Integration host factor n=8 Tax=Mycobacterium TaxID=1763 RepID=A0A1R3XYL4_MYCBO|nr:integration host factor, actinobacterial type [Mycobacterium tuberculosis]NP_215904.1 integration host factor MihF [Mycobacterium tuberculosis H37Rv]ABQ73140.1 putative integration host factor MihF [Mycobacterium tuberculosis H37Ra]ABR05760.1 integration host factor mihF [Mycobacterium tuberculosis F11]ACT25669.1 integration host factor mihF [Mycobacterium tuberculosis KZN 1435]AEB04734.1 integration host factor mihF [Mycobacterium tuberculosis KZN 4207]AEM99848.1 putative integration host